MLASLSVSYLQFFSDCMGKIISLQTVIVVVPGRMLRCSLAPYRYSGSFALPSRSHPSLGKLAKTDA